MQPKPGPNRWMLVFVLLLGPILGWAKLEHQREHPPEWARKPAHQYEGYVSIDGFARRAALVRDMLRGEDPGAERLRENLRSELHPNALAVPALVGAIALLSGSVPTAFMLLNLTFYLLTLSLIARLAHRHMEALGLDHARSRATWAVLVFAAHVDTCRNVLQLHIDFSVTCVGLAVVFSALDVVAGRWRPRQAMATSGLQLFGVFTKASFAPFLAVLPLACWFGGCAAKHWRSAALGVAIPLSIWLAFTLALGGDASALRDAEHFRASWRFEPAQLGKFALEFALALQWLPLVAFLPAARSSPLARFVLCMAVLYLFGLLAFGLPAVPRLYLPAIALLCALCVPVLLAVEQRAGRWPIYAWVGLNLLLGAIGVRYGG